MKFLVVYASHPSRSTVRSIRRILGSSVDVDSVLPMVSDPIDTDERAHDMLAALRESWTPGRDELAMLQPEDAAIPAMSKDAAIALVQQREEWRELLAGFGASPPGVELEAKEHPRCVVVAVSVATGGIPPGLGFIIDKLSGRVLPRRFVDVVGDDGRLI